MRCRRPQYEQTASPASASRGLFRSRIRDRRGHGRNLGIRYVPANGAAAERRFVQSRRTRLLLRRICLACTFPNSVRTRTVGSRQVFATLFLRGPTWPRVFPVRLRHRCEAGRRSLKRAADRVSLAPRIPQKRGTAAAARPDPGYCAHTVPPLRNSPAHGPVRGDRLQPRRHGKALVDRIQSGANGSVQP